jgi:hypothetical protein
LGANSLKYAVTSSPGDSLATYIIGDLHGHITDYTRLLIAQGLCDDKLRWTGGEHVLWQIGDFFDRGPSGVACMDLTMSLQAQARDAGGDVNALLGNHELMMLCAHRFGDRQFNGVTVRDIWLQWGGIASDEAGFGKAHEEFIRGLPAMVRLDTNLLIHADAMLYVNHGITLDSVNASFSALLEEEDLDAWMATLNGFGEHMAFSGPNMSGSKRAGQFLKLFGAGRLIHGHTPIPYARGVDAAGVTRAWEYADGLCVNVDGGIYMGSPGFVYQLDD